MTQPHPDRFYFNVDLVDVDASSITVRDRASGLQHIIAYDGIAIGANEAGGGYTLIVPRDIAFREGLAHAV